MADAPQSLTPGTLLGGVYRIVDRRAVGGMGEVYVARHARWSGPFAIKIPNRRWQDDPAVLARFAQEAAMLALVQHANVVRLIEFQPGGPQGPFIAMEYLEGNDLAQHMAEHGPIPPRRVATMVCQVAAALEIAHVRRIVHADIKPGNVFLQAGAGGAAKVLDFGVAHFFGQRPSLSTPAYMAPEQALGQVQQIDSRTDQFALAALSYALLTGMDPFGGDCTAQVLDGILHDQPRALHDCLPWPAEELDGVLQRALSKRPDDRFASVTEYAERLAAAAERIRDRAAEAEGWMSRRRERRERPRMDREVVGAARRGYQTTIVARQADRPAAPPWQPNARCVSA